MEDQLLRRRFLQGGTLAATGLAGASSLLFAAQDKPSGGGTGRKKVSFGIIGVGMQGSGLLDAALSLPDVECTGAADLYDGRHVLAREITHNPSLFTTRRYKELLNRKDVDCIIAAVPDFWHQRVVVDACNAGKDVYCEKPMTHTAEEGFAMIDAEKKNQRILQIGSQRVSSALCAKARQMYKDGAIGEVSMVELSLGRNSPTGSWQYPPPPDLSPSNLDWDTWLQGAPKIPFDPARFARWRCWKEYGTGVGGDLMVHLISGMLHTLGWNEAPVSAQALGGIYRWKDGRNMPDLHVVLFDYHGIPVYVRLGLGTATPEMARFMGPKGMIEATGEDLRYSPQDGEDHAPSYYSGGFPGKLRAQYVEEWHAKHDPPFGKEPIAGDTILHGHDWDDVHPHLWNFFEAVRTRQPVTEDGTFGNHAAIACHMANESYFRKKPVTWDAGSRRIKS